MDNFLPDRFKKWLTHSNVNEFCILIRLTENCNLACQYCYVRDTSESDFRISTLERLFKSLADLSEEKIRIIWHGGEPLLVGEEKFLEIIHLQNKFLSKKVVKNSIQTNGAFSNSSKLINFLVNNNFDIGVSFDGCEIIQNKQRPTSDNKPSFSLTSSFIKNLKDKTGSASIIQVVTKESINYIESFEKNYKKLGITSVKYVPYYEFIEDKLQSISPAEYFVFLKKTFDIWTKESNPQYSISNFLEIFNGLLGGSMRSCSNNGMCLTHLMANQDGDIYSCSRLSFMENHKIGNVFEQELKEIINSQKFKDIAVGFYSSTKTECKKCKWYNMCYKGCYSHESKGKTYFCSTNKKIFNYINDFVNQYKKEVNYV